MSSWGPHWPPPRRNMPSHTAKTLQGAAGSAGQPWFRLMSSVLWSWAEKTEGQISPKMGRAGVCCLPRRWRGGVQPYFWEDISTWNGAAWRPLALPTGHQSRTWAEAQKIKLAVPSCSPQRLSKVPLPGASPALLALCPWLCSVLATSGATLVSRAALPLGSLTLFPTQSHLSLKDFLSFKKSLPFHLFSVSFQIS